MAENTVGFTSPGEGIYFTAVATVQFLTSRTFPVMMFPVLNFLERMYD